MSTATTATAATTDATDESSSPVMDAIDSAPPAAPVVMVRLASLDGEEFSVSSAVIRLSSMVAAMMDEHDGECEVIPLPGVLAATLGQVVQFCERYAAEPMTPIEKPLKSNDLTTLVQPFYASFVPVDQDALLRLTLAANYLDVPPLLALCLARIAGFIKDRTVEEIRENLGIQVTHSTEEEAALREEYKWAFDPLEEAKA